MSKHTTLAVVSLAILSLPALVAAQPLDAEEADRIRIREHLGAVEAELRAVDVSHLDDAQRAARAEMLDALHDYHVAGVFPRNRHVPGRNPVFIDEEDRACAMGHLIMVSGHEDAARTIAAEQNLVRVPDIDAVDLGPWLDAHGMTLEEAARVQPSYCFCTDQDAPVCGEDGRTYRNSCIAETCRGTTVASSGECDGNTEEPIVDCVCDGDGGGCSATGDSTAPPLLAVLGAIGLGLLLRRRKA